MMQKVIGVFGSSTGGLVQDNIQKARRLGQAIAENGCVLVTGACPGLPYEASLAAKKGGGIVIGVSPAGSEREHKAKYGYPVDAFDFIAYPGNGTKGRNVISVRSCDIAIFISGGMGSLNEFTVAFDEGKRIGVYTGTGGITDIIEDVAKKAIRKTGATIVYDSEPEKLLEKLLGSV